MSEHNSLEKNVSEHVYLIQTRECCRIDKNVYKLGRSDMIESRMKNYPKHSEIHLIISVKNSRQIESELIKIFGEKFEKAVIPSGEPYGNEYFKGNLSDMKRVFISYIMDDNTSTEIIPSHDIQEEEQRLLNIEYDTLQNIKRVSTYNDFLNFSSTIHKILITDVSTETGYYDSEYGRDKIYDLGDLIEETKTEKAYLSNTTNKWWNGEDEPDDIKNYTVFDIVYDKEKIKTDILSTCFDKNFLKKEPAFDAVKKFFTEADVKSKLNKIKRRLLSQYSITNNGNDRILVDELTDVYGDDFREYGNRYSAEDILYVLIFEKVIFNNGRGSDLDKMINIMDDYSVENIISNAIRFAYTDIKIKCEPTLSVCCYLKRIEPKRISKINVSVNTVEQVLTNFFVKYGINICSNGVCQCLHNYKKKCSFNGKFDALTPETITRIQSICDNICDWFVNTGSKHRGGSYGFKHVIERMRKLSGDPRGGYVSNAEAIVSLLLLGIEVSYNKERKSPNVGFSTLHQIIENLPEKYLNSVL